MNTSVKVILFFFLLHSKNLLAVNLSFKKDGILVKEVDHSRIHNSQIKNNNFVIKAERVYNIFRRYHKEYTGFAFKKTMDSIYGASWQKSKFVLFKAKDGFEKKTLTQYLVKSLSSHEGIIAFKEKGRDEQGSCDIHRDERFRT